MKYIIIFYQLWTIMNNSIVPKFSQICKIISNNFEDVLLEQIIIDKYTVGILNNIDIYENIATFVHILSSFNEKITLIAKNKHSYLHGINMKNPNRKNEEQGCTYILV